MKNHNFLHYLLLLFFLLYHSYVFSAEAKNSDPFQELDKLEFFVSPYLGEVFILKNVLYQGQHVYFLKFKRGQRNVITSNISKKDYELLSKELKFFLRPKYKIDCNHPFRMQHSIKGKITVNKHFCLKNLKLDQQKKIGDISQKLHDRLFKKSPKTKRPPKQSKKG